MNDTPRTDAYIKDPSLPMVPAGLARQLERELNEAKKTIDIQHELMVTAEKRGADKASEELKMANDYIKRLEEVGDNLYVGWRSERNNKDKYLENWKQAKENKP